MINLVRNILLPFTLIVLGTTILNAQCEKIFVHFDKSYYVVGETIWYKAFLTNCAELRIPPSNILHVELLDKKGKVQVHQKLKIQNDAAFGEIKIPTSWVENVYTFRAYTLLIPGPVSRTIYAKGIPIYSDFEIKRLSADNQIVIPDITEVSLPLKIDLKTNEPIYNKRSTVTLSVECTNGRGNGVAADISVAVKDANFFAKEPASQALINLNNHENSVTSTGLRPEEGITIYSKFYDENDKNIKIPLLSIYDVNQMTNSWSGTDVNGNSRLALPEFTGTKIFQMTEIGAVRNRPRRVEERSPLNEDAPLIKMDIPYDSNIIRYLELSKKRKQFDQIFKKEDAEIKREIKELLLVEKPDRVYRASDYIEFSDTEEFLREVVIPMRLAKNKSGGFELRLSEEADGVPVYKPPLILIDNYVTFDVNELLKIDVNDIERVELLLRKKRVTEMFGAFARNGVMLVYTKSQNPEIPLKLADNILTVEGFHQSRNYTAIQKEFSNAGIQSSPDLRPMLYWNPEVKTDGNGKVTLRFDTSDDISEYLIEVIGVGIDGNPGRATTTFHVKR